MSRFDKIALFISLLGVLAAALTAERVFERMPHLEDEVAYVWQARTLANGDLKIPSPEHPKSFLVPFVVDYEGERFGKYPPGWPALLAVGEIIGARWLINSVLAGVGVYLTYLLGKKVFNPAVGLLAAALTVPSPFFLMNSGSLLSHPLGLALSLGFVLVWLENFGDLKGRRKTWLTLLGAALLGWLVITRPWTAVAVAFPFIFHGLVLFIRGSGQTRLHLLGFCAVVIASGGLLLLWQNALTGDPLLNPYTLWWSYDTVGFGPGHGRKEAGHNLAQALINTKHSLDPGADDIFGWGKFTFLAIPFGVWAARRNWRALLSGSIFFSLILFYMAYWIGSSLFGPRYYYEGLFSLTLLTAVGVMWLAFDDQGAGRQGEVSLAADVPATVEAAPDGEALGFRASGLRTAAPASFRGAIAVFNRLRPWIAAVLLVAAVTYNLAGYLPQRMGEMYGLYDMRREMQEYFKTADAQEVTPALVIVHSERWMRYGVLIDLEDPYLTTPFIFAWSRGSNPDRELAASYPDRTVIHYYVDNPGVFYFEPRQ